MVSFQRASDRTMRARDKRCGAALILQSYIGQNDAMHRRNTEFYT
jgi:hypothetical protein